MCQMPFGVTAAAAAAAATVLPIGVPTAVMGDHLPLNMTAPFNLPKGFTCSVRDMQLR